MFGAKSAESVGHVRLVVREHKRARACCLALLFERFGEFGKNVHKSVATLRLRAFNVDLAQFEVDVRPLQRERFRASYARQQVEFEEVDVFAILSLFEKAGLLCGGQCASRLRTVAHTFHFGGYVLRDKVNAVRFAQCVAKSKVQIFARSRSLARADCAVNVERAKFFELSSFQPLGNVQADNAPQGEIVLNYKRRNLSNTICVFFAFKSIL